jgi:hypothetical protein
MTDPVESRPFDIEYVLKTTVTNMSKAVEVSISKTMARIGEFADNPEKSDEVFKTLTQLQTLKNSIVEFKSKNPEIFKEKAK